LRTDFDFDFDFDSDFDTFEFDTMKRSVYFSTRVIE